MPPSSFLRSLLISWGRGMGTLRMGVNFAVRRFLAVLAFLDEQG